MSDCKKHTNVVMDTCGACMVERIQELEVKLKDKTTPSFNTKVDESDVCCHKCGGVSGVYLQCCDDCMTRFNKLSMENGTGFHRESECDRDHNWVNSDVGVECDNCPIYVDAEMFTKLEKLMLDYIPADKIYGIIEDED
jgi:hypothetical protein